MLRARPEYIDKDDVLGPLIFYLTMDRPGPRLPRHALDVCRLRGARAPAPRARPRGVPPEGARHLGQGGARLVRVLDRARPRLRGLHLRRLREPLDGPRPDPGPDVRGRGRARRRRRLQRRSVGRGQVPHRVRGREVARRRQHLRDRDDLRLLRGAGDLPAPGAVLGHRRRAADARRDDRPRREADLRVRVDHLRVRRVPDPDRDQDAADQGRRDRPEPQRRSSA